MNPLLKLIVCACLICSRPGIADTLAKQGTDLAGVGSPMSFSYVVQILISFLVVIGFIFVMAWLVRRTGRFGYGTGQVIKIISSISLGMREKILVVEVGGENIVVGVAPGQIRTLHVLDSGAELANKDGGRSHGEGRVFKQLIDKFSKQ